MRLHNFAGIAAAALFAGTVGAQSPAQPATPSTGAPSTPVTTPSTTSPMTGGAADATLAAGFSTVDKDSDGSISKREAATNKGLTKKWDALDANKDGKLDQGEFAQFEVNGSASGSMGTTTDSGATKNSDKPKF